MENNFYVAFESIIHLIHLGSLNVTHTQNKNLFQSAKHLKIQMRFLPIRPYYQYTSGMHTAKYSMFWYGISVNFGDIDQLIWRSGTMHGRDTPLFFKFRSHRFRHVRRKIKHHWHRSIGFNRVPCTTVYWLAFNTFRSTQDGHTIADDTIRYNFEDLDNNFTAIYFERPTDNNTLRRKWIGNKLATSQCLN